MYSRRSLFFGIILIQLYIIQLYLPVLRNLPRRNFLPSVFNCWSSHPKIFCLILTQPKNFETKAKAVYETWAHKCDYHRFISVIPESYSNMTDESEEPGSTRKELYLNYSILQPNGHLQENYTKLTDKMIYSLIDVEQHFRGKFEWILKADDDTFVFVDNLRNFLSSKNPHDPFTYGYNFKVIVDKGYHSGGAGYVMSMDSLTKLSDNFNSNQTFCNNTGTEDVDIARCLRLLDVVPGSSVDDLGRERFHAFNIRIHYTGVYPGWIFSFAQNSPKSGLDCCSDQSITFHYVKQNDMYKLAEFIEKKPNWKFKDIAELIVKKT